MTWKQTILSIDVTVKPKQSNYNIIAAVLARRSLFLAEIYFILISVKQVQVTKQMLIKMETFEAATTLLMNLCMIVFVKLWIWIFYSKLNMMLLTRAGCQRRVAFSYDDYILTKYHSLDLLQLFEEDTTSFLKNYP